MRAIASGAQQPLPVPIDRIPATPWTPPPNAVALTRLDGETFYMDKTEVTVKAYRACVDAHACTPPVSGERQPDPKWRALEDKEGIPHTCPPALMTWDLAGHDDYPINCVTFSQAWRYCMSVGGRLPNEDEWEEVARGTAKRIDRRFPWPGGVDPTCTLAVIADRRGAGCGTGGPLPVGSKPKGASPIGALDMIGNVAEIIVGDEQPSRGLHVNDADFGYAGGSYADDFAGIDIGGRRGPAAPTVGFRCVYYPPGQGDYY